MKLTPWFIANKQPPLRNGWYDILWAGSETPWSKRLYWNGKNWLIRPDATVESNFATWNGDKWRGLAKPQKKAAVK